MLKVVICDDDNDKSILNNVANIVEIRLQKGR